MFENLTDRLSHTFKQVTGKASLSEDNIKDALREVRMALLEADVALPVVKDFIDTVRERRIEVAADSADGEQARQDPDQGNGHGDDRHEARRRNADVPEKADLFET